MEKETKKFLQAEETAVKLVETLKRLHTEVTSYATATKELGTVRQQLINMIESTEKVVNDSHEVIKILKKIGGPEILNRIAKLENKSTEEFAKQSKYIDKLNIKILKKIEGPEILNRLAKLENKSTEEFAKQSKYIDKLKTLIIATLASSITAIIIGIIAFLK